MKKLHEILALIAAAVQKLYRVLVLIVAASTVDSYGGKFRGHEYYNKE